MKQNYSILLRYELYFFIGFLFINLLPFLFFKFLPTLDGPSHLHNANLIYNLGFGDSSFITNYYQFTGELLPNWSGHFMLALFNSFLPGWIAEKMVVLIYLIMLPLSFRWFIKMINPDNFLFSYFIFPFCYSFTFFLGFYNFSLALIILFLILAFWINIQRNLTIPKILLLFVLFTALYFSHLFVFLISIMAIGVILIKDLIIERENKTWNMAFNCLCKKIAVIFLTSGIWIFFSYKFLESRNSFNYSYISKIELLKWIRDIRPTIVFNFGHEGVYTHVLFYLIVILTVIAAFHKIKEIAKTKTNFRELLVNLAIQNDLWFIFSFLLLLMYFFMPDSNGYSGYFSVRMGLLLYLFYIVWLATKKYNKWILITSVVLVFFANSGLNFYYLKQVKQLNKLATEINQQSILIDSNSIVLPMNFSENWMHGHFSNYLGIDKPIVILENYECGTGYFPIKWNDNFPNTTIGNLSKNEFCNDWKTNSLSTVQYPVNYVFILGNQHELDNNECAQSSIKKITKYYNLISKTENTQLYQLIE